MDHAPSLSFRSDIKNDNAASSSTTTPRLWHAYVQLVRRHRSKLLLWESFIDRLLWWYPGQSEGSIWRQVLWSCAELQHLAIDLALQQKPPGDGVTLDDGTAPTSDNNHALSFRIGLTVLHNLWPVLYDRLSTQPRRHRLYWELQLERLRFVLRLAVMLPHWWNMTVRYPMVQPGILQRGGLLIPSYASSQLLPTAQMQAQRAAYVTYVGRRTGKRVFETKGANTATSTDPNTGRVFLGELLHILRPLFWAHCQYHDAKRQKQPFHNSHSDLWMSWLASLGLDVVSLVCLQQQQNHHYQENAATREEWRRRGVRLLLYLLRTPSRESFVQPAMDKIHHGLSRVPLLGNLLSAYLQDWLYYWTVYRLEE